MKALMLTGPERLELRERPDPSPPAAGEVRIRMTHVGICGSDLHYYRHGRIGDQVIAGPFTLGHEGAGVVEAVGPGVAHVRPGDRVAIDPAMPCGACDQCRGGRSHTCRKLRFLGCPGQAEGCLSERILMPQTSCFPIPPELTLEQAALAEPQSVAEHAVRLAGPLAGARVGVLGVGPIGLCVLFAARATGATVHVTDRLDHRLAFAARHGATSAGNPDREDVVRAILGAEPRQLDVVFECCGQQEALDQAVELLHPGGRLLLVGIPAADRVSFRIDTMRRRELALQNVRRQNECVPGALERIRRGEAPVTDLVTHRVPLADAARAFAIVAAYADGVIKAVVEL